MSDYLNSPDGKFWEETARDPKTGRFVGGYKKGYFQRLPEWKQEEMRRNASEIALKAHQNKDFKFRNPPRHTKEEMRKWFGRKVVMITPEGKFRKFNCVPEAAEFVIMKKLGVLDSKKVYTLTKNIHTTCTLNRTNYKDSNDHTSAGYRWYRDEDKDLWMDKIKK